MDETTKRLHKKRIAKVQDYQSTFSSPHGKRVLHDLMVAHHMMDPMMPADAFNLALKEGERNVVLRILSVLKTSPEDLQKLLNRGDEYAP